MLEKKVDELDNRVTKIEESHVAEREKIFFDGQFFDARVFLKELFIKAEKEIILIDPYADILALDYIKAKSNGVVINLFISSKANYLKKMLTHSTINTVACPLRLTMLFTIDS
ncbi:MAG: hypothetical protein MR990_03330 [Mollicutes bacterium]|nr:hypothetical protein [Mollicutes bacterium]MDY6070155.1 hypothetical protein [Bacilli bacterium]